MREAPPQPSQPSRLIKRGLARLESWCVLGRILNKEASVDHSLINAGFLDSVLTGVGRWERWQLEHADVC